jgi:anti-anti-sigma factor
MNSANVAKLLRLRKKMMQLGRRLIICDINSHVQGIFSVTGLDKMFDFAGDVSTALATVQLSNGGGDKG